MMTGAICSCLFASVHAIMCLISMKRQRILNPHDLIGMLSVMVMPIYFGYTYESTKQK